LPRSLRNNQATEATSLVASSLVFSSSKHRRNAKDCPGDDLSIRGRGRADAPWSL
jgi:hypothetical protein